MAKMDIFAMTDTWNASGTTFDAIRMNVTDTASAANSRLIDLLVGGASRFSVRKDGLATTGSLVTTTVTANLPAIESSGFSLTGSNAQSLVDLAGTWNTLGTPTLIKANVTDSSSNASSLLMDLQVSGSSQFSVDKAGAVSTKTLTTTGPATNLSVISSTGYSLTGSSATPMVSLTGTWNTTGAPSAFLLNVTDTASAAGSRLLDLQVNGASKVRITKSGMIDFDAADSGFLRDSGGGTLRWRISGADRGAFGLGSIQVFGTANVLFGDLGDVILARDAADTLALRRTTNAQVFRIYNTFTDASNYERLTFTWSGSGDARIQTEKAGTGTVRSLIFGTDGSARWLVGSTTGHFLAATDNTFDIGASGANRPRNVFWAGYQEMSEMTAPAAPATNNVRIYAEDNGSGKTRLMARFATGAAVQIAIEP